MNHVFIFNPCQNPKDFFILKEKSSSTYLSNSQGTSNSKDILKENKVGGFALSNVKCTTKQQKL
jgi:hypothetical protein